MKFLKVTKGFRDKENDEKTVEPGEVIERSNKRVDELVSNGFGEDVTKEEEAKQKKAEPKTDDTKTKKK